VYYDLTIVITWYDPDMPLTLQARLDRKTQRTLERLRKQTGLSDSELARRGLEALARDLDEQAMPLTGVGAHDSGVVDLATNPHHMKGFGA
jgi:hypothetical protein